MLWQEFSAYFYFSFAAIGSTGLTGRHNVSMFTGGDYIKYELGKEKEVLKIIFMPRDVS